jgi:hypothetical protein
MVDFPRPVSELHLLSLRSRCAGFPSRATSFQRTLFLPVLPEQSPHQPRNLRTTFNTTPSPISTHQIQQAPLSLNHLDSSNFAGRAPTSGALIGLPTVDMDAPAPLLRLPPELTTLIAAFLRVEYLDLNADGEISVVTEPVLSMSASERSMYDFRAFRLTCKDVYLKTFRLFGRRYFSKVSVGFAFVGLRRLKDIACYKNTFGLTLAEFPSHLSISTFRLPSIPLLAGRRWVPPWAPADAHAIRACILLLACQLGSGNYSVTGPYSYDIHAVASQYRSALCDQQLIGILDKDINAIAYSMGGFPNLTSITLDPRAKSWGVRDWSTITGREEKTFTENEDTCTGQSDMEYTFQRVLQAIAKAETLCQVTGRKLNLSKIEAERSVAGIIKLQNLHVQPSSRATLQAAFSRLTSITINIDNFSKPDELEEDTRRIADTLRLLLSSSGLKELSLDLIDDDDNITGDLSDANRPDHTWIGDHILSMVSDIECSNGLRSLCLDVNAIIESKAAVQKLIQKHASTLESIDIYAPVAIPTLGPINVPDARDGFKSLMRTIVGCPNLRSFTFFIGCGDPVIADVSVFASKDKQAVAARLQELIMSPTGPAHDHVWNDEVKQEEPRD